MLMAKSLNSTLVVSRTNSEFKRTSYDEIQYSDLTIGEQRLFTVLKTLERNGKNVKIEI